MFAAIKPLLFNQPSQNCAVETIGDITNFSILPTGNFGGCYDLDTGPHHVFFDSAVRHSTNGQQEYGTDGAMGAKGKVD